MDGAMRPSPKASAGIENRRLKKISSDANWPRSRLMSPCACVERSSTSMMRKRNSRYRTRNWSRFNQVALASGSLNHLDTGDSGFVPSRMTEWRNARAGESAAGASYAHPIRQGLFAGSSRS